MQCNDCGVPIPIRPPFAGTADVRCLSKNRFRKGDRGTGGVSGQQTK
jgi:hypothetical protein